MSIAENAKKDYDNSAASYNDYSSLPCGRLESQMIKIALGDCTGLRILDLGGGTGLHAREAIELGAASVDIVDISPEMLKVGQEIEKSLGRENTLRFFEADVSKPIKHLPLSDDSYDVVMGNWIFSYANDVETLEGMLHNIVTYLKPGGRFVGVRDTDPKFLTDDFSGKYGFSCKWTKEIEGGMQYLCVLHCTPPVEFVSTTLEVIYSGSTEIYRKFGLTDVKFVSCEEAEIVQKDQEFWKDFMKRPVLAVTQATKRNT